MCIDLITYWAPVSFGGAVGVALGFLAWRVELKCLRARVLRVELERDRANQRADGYFLQIINPSQGAVR